MVSTVYRHSHTAVLQAADTEAVPRTKVPLVVRHICRPGQARVAGAGGGRGEGIAPRCGFKVSPVSAPPPRFWRQNLPSILYLASTSTQYAAPTLPSHQCTLGHKLYSLGELIVRHTRILWASAYLPHVYLINIFHTLHYTYNHAKAKYAVPETKSWITLCQIYNL